MLNHQCVWIIALILFISVFSATASAVYNWVEEAQKIQASDKEAIDYFSRSVSISGNYAIVGADGEDTGGSYAGAAYVFERNASGSWNEVNKIQASDKEASDYFGDSVSISGNYAIVGAQYEDTGGSGAGAAYIFERNASGSWNEVNKIQASDKEASDYFGRSISISGNYAIVGADGEDTGGSEAGAAYVFERNATGSWNEVNKIQASDKEANDYFGSSISISGNYTIVGARGEDTGGSYAGAAYVFNLIDTVVVQISSPTEGQVITTDSFYINYTVIPTEGETADSCWYNLSGTNSTPVAAGTYFELNYDDYGYGNHTVVIYCNDSSGTVGRSVNDITGVNDLTFTLNPQLTLELLTPTTNITVMNQSWFEVTAEITCIGGDCGYVNVTLDPLIVSGATVTRVGDGPGAGYFYTDTDCSGVDVGDWVAFTSGILFETCVEIGAIWENPGEWSLRTAYPEVGDTFSIYDTESECVSSFDNTQKQDGIVPVGSGSPFYTNSSTNPVTINLGNSSQPSQNITFWVKANVTELGVYEDFFIYTTTLNVSSVDDESSKFDVNVTETRVDVSDIYWSTTGGFTDNTLIYSQILDYINATCTSPLSVSWCNLTVTDPDSSVIVNNVNMTAGGDEWTYTTDINLNKVGIWTINVTGGDGTNTGSLEETINVSVVQQDSFDGIFGYRTDSIPSNATMTDLAAYNYNLIEIQDNSDSIVWADTLKAIAHAHSLNMKVGYTVNLTYDLSDPTTPRAALISEWEANISDLLAAPYIDTVEYLRIRVPLGVYTDTEYTNDNIDILSPVLFAETGNYFAIYTNYNSSTLDTDYIVYDNGYLIYVTGTTNSGIVNELANLSRSITSNTRIYYNLTTAGKTLSQTYFDDIMTQLPGTWNTSTAITNLLVSELSTGDLVIYNNGSATADLSDFNISQGTNVIGKDIWDYTNGILEENNTDGIVTFQDVAVGAILVGGEDIDHIVIGTSSSTVYEAPTATVYSTNLSDGAGDEYWNSNTNARATELWDNSYVAPTAAIFYGDFGSHTGVDLPDVFDGLDILIINDRDSDTETDKLFSEVSINYVFNYMAVADYSAAPASHNYTWVDAKKAEVDTICALNANMNVFIDGFDIGDLGDTGYFFEDAKNVTDYIKTTKGREVGVNIFTNFQEMSQLSTDNGFAMFESAIGTWTLCVKGASGCYGSYNATHGYDFSTYVWGGATGSYNKSIWYNNHGLNVVPVAFMAMNNTAYLPDALSNTDNESSYYRMQQLYLINKLLGYDNIVITEPGFRLAYNNKYINTGNQLQSEPEVNGDIYTMRCENGIITYNATSGIATFDDGRAFNNASITLNLYDVAAYTHTVNVNGVEFPLVTTGSGWTAPASYPEYTIYLTESVYNNAYGHYTINLTTATADGGVAADTSGTSMRRGWYHDGTYWLNDNDGWMMAKLLVNTTKSGALDTTTQITQTDSTTNYLSELNISSMYSFNTTIWSESFTLPGGTFQDASIWDGDSYEILNIGSSADCLSDNPTYTTTAVTGVGSVGACYSGSDYRFSVPHLSDQIILLDADVTPPVVSWNWAAKNTYSSVNTATPAVTIDETANCTIYYGASSQANSSSGTVASWSLTSLPEGNLTYNVTCDDANGNAGVSTNAWYFVDTVDPTVTYNWTDENQTILTNSTTICVDIDETIPLCAFTINGSTTNNLTDGTTSCNTLSSMVDAFNYTVQVTCYDFANNNDATSESWVVYSAADIIPPIITPPTNATLELSVDSLNVDFDANEVTDTWSVNNSNFTINSTGGLINNTAIGLGTYILNITVNDTSGNIGWVGYQVVVEDTTNPSVIINITPQTIEAFTGISIFNATCTDVAMQQMNYTIIYPNGTLQTEAIGVVGYTIEYPFSSNITGNHNITVNCSDTSGNLNSTTTYITVEDTTAPTITAPANATTNNQTTFSADFNATDVSSLDTWTVNDSDFTINSSGILINATVLSVGTHILNVTINDTFGNTAWVGYSVEIANVSGDMTITNSIPATGCHNEDFTLNWAFDLEDGALIADTSLSLVLPSGCSCLSGCTYTNTSMTSDVTGSSQVLCNNPGETPTIGVSVTYINGTGIYTEVVNDSIAIAACITSSSGNDAQVEFEFTQDIYSNSLGNMDENRKIILEVGVNNKQNKFTGEIFFNKYDVDDLSPGELNTNLWCGVVDGDLRTYNYPSYYITKGIEIECNIPLGIENMGADYKEEICIRDVGSLEFDCSTISFISVDKKYLEGANVVEDFITSNLILIILIIGVLIMMPIAFKNK